MLINNIVIMGYMKSFEELKTKRYSQAYKADCMSRRYWELNVIPDERLPSYSRIGDHKKVPSSYFHFIWDYFEVSYESFEYGIDDAMIDGSLKEIITRHVRDERLTCNTFSDRINTLFLQRRLNQVEFESLETLVPKMKENDLKRAKMKSEYEKIKTKQSFQY